MKNSEQTPPTAEVKDATLKLILKGKSRSSAEATYNINVDQWEVINAVCGSDKVARLSKAAPKLLEVLKRYDAWEARLIESDEAWEGRNFAITDELYEEFMEIQALRNQAIEKATGKGVFGG